MANLRELSQEEYEEIARVANLEVEEAKRMYRVLMAAGVTEEDMRRGYEKITKKRGSFLLSVASGATVGALWTLAKNGAGSITESWWSENNFPLPEWVSKAAGSALTGVTAGTGLALAKRWKSWLLGFGLAARFSPAAFQQLVSLYDENFLNRSDAEKTAIITNVSRFSPLHATPFILAGAAVGFFLLIMSPTVTGISH